MTRAWNKDYYRFRLRAHEAQEAIELLRSRAMVVEPAPLIRNIGDDEEDDLVVATAVAGHASYLVTGDKGFLRLIQFQGIKLLTPRDFLSILTDR
jgi:uncharacterized protein